MNEQVVVNGMQLENFWERITEIIRSEVRAAEEDRIRPITKKFAYTALGICPRTLDKALKELNKTSLYFNDIAVIKYHLGHKSDKYARTTKFK